MSKNPLVLPRDVAVAERRHKALVKLIERQGVNNLDPKSPAGAFVMEWTARLMEASDKKIPEIFKLALIEQAIAAMLIARSAVTFISHIRAPAANLTPTSEAKLKAYNAANSSWRGSVNVLTKIFTMLGVGNKEESSKNNQLAELYKELGVEAGEAE